jgi:hypothetical protein
MRGIIEQQRWRGYCLLWCLVSRLWFKGEISRLLNLKLINEIKTDPELLCSIRTLKIRDHLSSSNPEFLGHTKEILGLRTLSFRGLDR